MVVKKNPDRKKKKKLKIIFFSELVDGMSTIKCLFWNVNDSVVKLMVSVTSGVSLC